MTKYDPHTTDCGLFADHINTFFKRNAEASGYRTWVFNRDDEERFVETVNARESVLMDRDAIRPNAAKSGMAKLCLNSLCKTSSESRYRNQTKLISDPQELYTFLPTPGFEFAN